MSHPGAVESATAVCDDGAPERAWGHERVDATADPERPAVVEADADLGMGEPMGHQRGPADRDGDNALLRMFDIRDTEYRELGPSGRQAPVMRPSELQALDLQELLEAMTAVFAADTGLLVTAEGGVGVE